MTAELAVELSDLNGWAMQVGRAGRDAHNLGLYAGNNVTDGNFGAILELITAPYEAMIPNFHEVLATDGDRLDATCSALQAVKEDYRDTDSKVAQDFGIGAAITDDGVAAGFADSGSTTPAAPSSGGGELPEVSFGFIFDKVCDVIEWVGGPDPREYVTRWIVGDMAKAGMHASAWDHASECLKAVEQNLASGAAAIGKTWTGDAATASAAQIDQWVSALGEQAAGMSQAGGHIKDMVSQALDMAQVVVDIVKTVISLVSAALSSAYIPFWGQAKLIKTAKEAITLINNARKVITVFWNALNMVKDGFLMIAHAFGVEKLPAAPTTP
jgi:uncharacterized protein YukE